MLNLLIISDSSKAAYVKSVLQPDLKVIIDVVTDFDLGLKNVFEKRPSIVCIQDQIGGVTGENVARHIQMLLGSNAPKFILFHTGNGKARLIKGLYDHIVDLNHPGETVAEDVTNILKSLLGETWDRIYIPPRLAPALVRSSAAVTEEAQEDIDKLLDDAFTPRAIDEFSAIPVKTADNGAEAIFQSMLEETAAISTAAVSPRPTEAVPAPTAEIPPPAASKPAPVSPVSATATVKMPQAPVPPPAAVVKTPSSAGTPVAGVQPSRPAVLPSAPLVKPPPAAVVRQQAAPVPPPKPAQPAGSAGTAPLVKQAVSAPAKVEPATAPVPLVKSPAPQMPPIAAPAASAGPVAPPDLKASHDPAPAEILGIGLQPDRSYMRRSVVIAALCVVSIICAGGGWYLARELQQPAESVKQEVTVRPEVQQAPVEAPAVVSPPAPVPPAEKQAPPLPEFIPRDGRDPAYASKNPGWERYVGEDAEFRVFSAEGKIQAVQVVVVNDVPLSRSMMKKVLQEFAGSSDYRITSRTRESGIRVESGTICNSYDVMLYRKKGALVAFIVSAS